MDDNKIHRTAVSLDLGNLFEGVSSLGCKSLYFDKKICYTAEWV